MDDIRDMIDLVEDHNVPIAELDAQYHYNVTWDLCSLSTLSRISAMTQAWNAETANARGTRRLRKTGPCIRCELNHERVRYGHAFQLQVGVDCIRKCDGHEDICRDCLSLSATRNSKIWSMPCVR